MTATFRLAMASDANSIEGQNALSPWQLRHCESRGLPPSAFRHAILFEGRGLRQHYPVRGVGTTSASHRHSSAASGCEGILRRAGLMWAWVAILEEASAERRDRRG
jgi:hypothetical protein